MDDIDMSSMLHYKRGIYYVNRLLSLFPNGRLDKCKEEEFVKREALRFKNNDIAVFDVNNFLFLCTVVLMGLNKEAIEDSQKNKNYEFKIDYSIADHRKQKNIPSWVDKQIQEFENARKVATKYDDWLSVSNINTIANYNYNYLFNVRNSMMHSEYNFNLIKGHAIYVANLNNSNYSGFNAKIHVPKYYEFIKHYFSNDSYFGLVENMYILKTFDENISIDNEEDLIDFATKKAKIIKLEYDNKLNANKILERTLLSTDSIKKITDYDINKHNIRTSEYKLSPEELAQIIYIIKDYYGADYYNLSKDEKIRTFNLACKYVLDPKAVISSWVIHFYNLIRFSPANYYQEDKFFSLFAMKPSLLIIKSYLILYRLQNKELSKSEIDYSQMTIGNYEYDLNHYNDYKTKLFNKGLILSEDEYKSRYFTEIFRDALAHGNVGVIYRNESNKITKYFKFTDIWKTKIRTIIISMDELEKYLSLECFDTKKIINSENKTK